MRKVVVVMEHCSKDGASNVVSECTLPLTGRRCVDLLITDLAVLEMDTARRRFRLIQTAPGVSVDEVRARTAAQIEVAPDVRAMDV